MLTLELAKRCGWKENGRYDLIVAGAGPTGIGAAVAAGRKGLKVALLESYGYAGGAGTQSCTPLYFGFGVSGKQSTAGLSDEFIRRMDKEGAASLILYDKCAMPEFRPIGDRPLTSKVQLHPETMKLVYRRMLEEAGVETIFYAKVVDAVVEEEVSRKEHEGDISEEKAFSGKKIKALVVSCLEGTCLMYADYFIDATGDGHLFQMAGAPVRKYAQEDGLHKSMFFFVGGVTPFDHEYNCKLYKEAYEAGRLPEWVWDHFGYSVQLNPGVVQIGVCYAEGDALDSREMSRMDMQLRENVFTIVDFLKKEMPGFAGCYLLETASHIGVRMAQGIVGRDTVTEENILQGIITEEPVALTRRYFGAHANHAGEGKHVSDAKHTGDAKCTNAAEKHERIKKFMASWSQELEGFAAVPMGALVSPALSNALAAGRCISSEPRVISTFRMMNTCMTLGEAAGLMISLCADGKEDVRELSYGRLRPELEKSGFLLEDYEAEL